MGLLQRFLISFSLLVATSLSGRLAFWFFQHPQDIPMINTLVAVLWGLRFDFAVSAVLALLLLLVLISLRRLQTQLLAPTLAFTSLFLMLCYGADHIYYIDNGRHVSYEVLDALTSSTELLQQAIIGYPRLFAVYAIIAAAWSIATFIGIRKLEIRSHAMPTRTQPLLHKIMQGGIVVLLSVVAIRGGAQSVPLQPLDANAIGDPRLATFVTSGPYNGLFAILSHRRATRVVAESSSKDEENWQTLQHALRSQTSTPLTMSQAPNVVMVFLESWSAVHMASYGGPANPTPQLDALRQQGITSFATFAGGHRTTEGLFTSLCSAQNPLGGTVAQSSLQSYSYRCLPHILADAGYSSAFFQGTHKNTSGTGLFAQLLGFHDSYGREDMGKPTVQMNSWGYHDPDTYAFVLEHLRHMPHPALIGINTATTHDILLPPEITPLFGMDNPVNRYRSILHYADMALGKFVTDLRNDPSIGPTIIVLMADHAGESPQVSYQRYLIPMVILGDGIQPQFIDRFTTQRDIAPTLLGLLGLPVPTYFTGSDLRADVAGPADYFDAGWLGWVEGKNGIEVTTTGELGTCRQWGNTPLAEHTAPCNSAATETALSLSRAWQTHLFNGQLKEPE